MIYVEKLRALARNRKHQLGVAEACIEALVAAEDDPYYRDASDDERIRLYVPVLNGLIEGVIKNCSVGFRGGNVETFGPRMIAEISDGKTTRGNDRDQLLESVLEARVQIRNGHLMPRDLDWVQIVATARYVKQHLP